MSIDLATAVEVEWLDRIFCGKESTLIKKMTPCDCQILNYLDKKGNARKMRTS